MAESFALSAFLFIFAHGLNSPIRSNKSSFVIKRTFTNVIFYVRISQIQDQKRRNKDVHFGCIVSCHIHYDSLNISRRGLSRVAYPGLGDARALTWDEQGVEHPRLSIK